MLRLPACAPLTLFLVSAFDSEVPAADWTEFRGPNRSGVSADANFPSQWSNDRHLKWKVDLPGAGSASPLVLGKRVFVVCYSGYGIPKARTGDVKSLQRHVVCLKREDGSVLWSRAIVGETPEDSYDGFLTEHGYASNSPVTDGERLYCFCGKSGVVAFDLDGNQLWQVNVGKDSSNRRWGSGASLILYQDTVIVNASEESRSIRALDKKTGAEKWKAAGASLELAYSTPLLVKTAAGKLDLVVAVPGEVWGLNPDTGKLRWYAEHGLTGNISPSVIADGDVAYIFGGFRAAGSLAIRVGGEGNVTQKNIVWNGRNSSYVATPLLHEGHLYWIDDRGQAFCVSAKSGEMVYRERVTGLTSGGRPVYASPVVAGGKMYVQTRWNGVLVLPAEPKYQVLEQNQFAGDDSDFNATPALSDGEIFLRSDKRLYCVGKK